MIDEMSALLKREQVDDDNKKEYCEDMIDKTEDKIKELELSISDLGKAVADAKETIATLADELAALEQGIKDLDKQVAEATETRKEDHATYVEELAANKAADELLGIAKNRLNKFYNPKLYKAPPKRELSEEERISVNMGGTLAPTAPPGGIAGTGVSFGQREAPPPPPETFGEYKKKGQESGGVMAMMDMLKADLEKEIQEMDFEEKDAQAEYETMVKDAAKKRGADLKSIAEKEAAKAQTEAEILASEDTKAAEEAELM